jgi:hypothetical protein
MTSTTSQPSPNMNSPNLDEFETPSEIRQDDTFDEEDVDEEEFFPMTDTSSVVTIESDRQTPPKRPQRKPSLKREEEPIKNVTQFDYLFFHATSATNVEVQQMVKCGVYSEYNKSTNMTLLLICDPATVLGNMEQQDEENEQDSDTIKQKLAQAAKRINHKLFSFVSFLQVKAQAHITMMHYLHYCPGMIHFIFVDRVRNRVISPDIVSLHTHHHAGHETLDDHTQSTMDVSTAFIKSKVWEMCHVSQQYRDEGYTEVGVCSNGVQYWSKEWLEDEQNVELRWTKPNLKQAKAHYELYTMYLPFVSTQAIAHHNKTLVAMLLDRPNK